MILLQILAGALLALGSGLIALALLRMEEEDTGRVGEGWRREHR